MPLLRHAAPDKTKQASSTGKQTIAGFGGRFAPLFPKMPGVGVNLMGFTPSYG
jgi:hypothetical protein